MPGWRWRHVLGAHELARTLQALGHDARIMAPKFIVPYRKNQKNDGNDAEAICEAVGRPNMRFVPIKSAEQQALLVVHRVRSELVQSRGGLISQVRSLLTEFGIVMPQGRFNFRHNHWRCARRCAPAHPGTPDPA